jgi:glycosyltransferase involved in cell wall biosynthesis
MTQKRNEPRVSVVILCYNQAHFVPEAIESGLSQTHGNMEVVMSDVSSPHNTAKVVGCWPRVRDKAPDHD